MQIMNVDEEVKVALIHAAVAWKDKEYNVKKLLSLNEEAARNGAKIIVNPELAISGYSFSSKTEIASQAEYIPGPVTDQFCELACRYQAYIALGMPEYVKKTGLYYNAAAFMGPKGEILGHARKIAPVYGENLWSTRGNLPVLVCDTAYGKVGVLICADVYWYKLSRVAALKGARLLVVLANWPPRHHPPEMYFRARALENGCYLLVSNRTGIDKSMDCTQARSYLLNPEGLIVNQLQSAKDAICYGAVPLHRGKYLSTSIQRLEPRRPEFYTDIALDVYNGFNSDALLQLPVPKPFAAASLQFRPGLLQPEENRQKMLSLVDQSLEMAEESKMDLKLVVFPEFSTTGLITDQNEVAQVAEEIPGVTVDLLVEKAREKKVYIAWGMVERDHDSFFNTAVLIGPEGLLGKYRKIHLADLDEKWARPGENEFFSCDLPFARVGLLLGHDLMFPESVECLAKRGVDLLCVPAFWTDKERQFLGDTRSAEQQLHLVITNQWGEGGDHVAVGGSALYSYARSPEERRKLIANDQGDEIRILFMDPQKTREKKHLELVDYELLLSKKNYC